MVYAFNPSTQDAEAGGFLCVQGQSGLQSEFQDSQGYTEKLCLKTHNDKKNYSQEVSIAFRGLLKEIFHVKTVTKPCPLRLWASGKAPTI